MSTAKTHQHTRAYFRKYLRRFVIGVVLLLTTIISGIVGFMVVCDYTLMEAYYMTIITLASVGYGEVKPLDTQGQIFASILIIFNMGIFAYAITSLSVFLVEGELGQFLKYKKLDTKIHKLHRHTIICGFGRHGQQIVEELAKMRMPFVVIEPDGDKVERLKETDHLFIEGDATNDDILHRAGIERARSLVVTFGEDAFNVYTVLSARQLNPHLRIISRAADQHAEEKLRRAGADYIVRSERIGGFYMATLINQPHVVEFFNLLSNMGETSIHFREIDYKRLKTEHKDKSLRELNFRAQTGINIIGLRHANGKYTINPSPDVCICKGMSIVVLGDVSHINAFENLVLERLSDTGGGA